jgi:hypothetical protein
LEGLQVRVGHHTLKYCCKHYLFVIKSHFLVAMKFYQAAVIITSTFPLSIQAKRRLKGSKKGAACEHVFYVSLAELAANPPIFTNSENLNPGATPVCDASGICSGFEVIQQDLNVYTDMAFTNKVGVWNNHGVFVTGLRQFVNGAIVLDDESEVTYAGEYLAAEEAPVSVQGDFPVVGGIGLFRKASGDLDIVEEIDHIKLDLNLC